MYNGIYDDDYKPIETYETFDNSYVEYQSEGNKDKILSIKEYLNMIRPYLSDIINNHKDEWKIQLSMRNNFIHSVDFKDSEDFEDSNKTRVMFTNSDNVVY